jgi:hypothetical protein
MGRARERQVAGQREMSSNLRVSGISVRLVDKTGTEPFVETPRFGANPELPDRHVCMEFERLHGRAGRGTRLRHDEFVLD